MARKPRVVIPGCPHHITHRGNLRAEVFFSADDRRFYLNMLGQCARRFGVKIWAYCLMTNHVRLIGVPERKWGTGNFSIWSIMLPGKIDRAPPRHSTFLLFLCVSVTPW